MYDGIIACIVILPGSLYVVDIYVLFRDARRKGYFEVGPKVSFLGDVKAGPQNGEKAIMNPDHYEKNPLAAVIGFGTYVLGMMEGSAVSWV